MKQSSPCELCAGEAAVYCDSDAAFLCWTCDAAVHGANFLVARHVRHAACASCRSFADDRALRVSGAGSRTRGRAALICRSCDPDRPDDESAPEDRRPPSPAASVSSSSCLSTSESASAAPPQKAAAGRRAPAAAKRRQLDGRAEGVLTWWCRRMGLRSGAQCGAAAARAFAAWGRTSAAALPPRVALAAALWSVIKLLEEGAGSTALRRLEACSGVPARLIVAAESRIVRSAGRVRLLEEGWAECS